MRMICVACHRLLHAVLTPRRPSASASGAPLAAH
jgi:hypothetical protein